MLGCAANQQQYSPEMTGFPGRTDRYCAGTVEGRGPSLDPAPPACWPRWAFGGAAHAAMNRMEDSDAKVFKEAFAQICNGTCDDCKASTARHHRSREKE